MQLRSIKAAAISAVLTTWLSSFSTGVAAAAFVESLSFYPTEQGEPYVAVSALSKAVAQSASVTGPFLIAMQTNYAYGSIDGIRFGTTASTDGQCTQPSDYGCNAYLLFELLPSAAVGLNYGTVTLSDGSSFQVVSNVRPAGLIVSPGSLEAQNSAGNPGDAYRIYLTNATEAALSIGKPSYVDTDSTPAASAFSFGGNCGSSLAAGATCFVATTYSPATNLNLEGFIEIPTGLGAIAVPFAAYADASSPVLTIDPQFIDFDVIKDGSSSVRTITITNTSKITVSTSIPGPIPPSCDPEDGNSCLNIVSDNCQTIAPQTSCEIKANYLVDPTQSFTAVEPSDGNSLTLFVNRITGDGLGSVSIGYAAYPTPGPPSAAVIAVVPSTLQFPATPFGQPSKPKSITVTNVSTRTLTVVAPSVGDFVAESSCAQLLPGASCEISLHFVPISGTPSAAESLMVNATDVADPTGLTTPQSQQIIAVSGSSIPEAALASPSYTVAPINNTSNVNLNVTNTSDVPLVFGSIYGNRGYYAGQAVIVDTTGCGASLAPSKSCTLIVNAHKCEDSDGECWLVLQSNALSSPDTYTFEGDATIDSHSVLTVDADPVVFPHTSVGASATQTVHVSLISSQTSVSEAFKVLPVLDPDFTIQNQCPAALVPRVPSGTDFTTSCEIVVTFAPRAQGFHVGTLTYRSSLQGGSVLLAGTAVAPVVAVAPTEVTFPATTVGSSTVAQMVTLTNPGSSAITIAGVVLGGAQADDFMSVSTCGTSLTAGASCTVAVTFKPVSAGNKVASITVGNSGGAPLKVALSGIGKASGAPSLSLAVSLISFPSQAAGTSSAAQTLVLTNEGTSNLALTSLVLTGPQADDFLLTNPCGAVLAVGASCTLAVTFKPVSAGTKHAVITVTDNAASSPQSVPLKGLGVAASAVPSVELSATSLTFPKQATGTNSVGQTVTLINSGASTLTLRSITLTGGQADDYVLAPTCGASLAAGAGCTLTVVFKPVSAGTKHASVIINDEASGSPQSIALTGTGT